MPCLKCYVLDTFQAQGFIVEKSVLFQNNISTMLLERTRMMSSSKCAKHIRVRYYFIKDCISAGDIVVKHFPTREMLSDHFTNPLQGKLFQTFRAKIQGIPTPMANEDMCWGAQGYFNMEPEATNMTTSNPRPQE